ncbi:hypothetical protein OH407_24040, partial [Salmonella enterica]|uniref:hypothetical protein n=1 Tax=Salmonella enterica TaxID=28901 RepID=UPI0022B6E1C3
TMAAGSALLHCCVTPDGGLAVGCRGGRVLLVDSLVWVRRREAVLAWMAVRAAAEAAGEWV